MSGEIDTNPLSTYAYVATVSTIIIVSAILVVAFSHYFAKYFLIRFVDFFFGKKRTGYRRLMFKNHVFHRIAYLIPAILLYHFSDLFNYRSVAFTIILGPLVKQLTIVYMLIDGALIVSALLNCVHDRYQNLEIAKQKPIKSYLEVIKIIIFVLTGILVASAVTDKSPTYFLTGVTAATAIVVLVFKDSIMGFVASIQLAAYDMVRIGDWIEMPSFGADGEVIDIALNTVKVQNFDKTIVTIPSYALLSSGVKNWRGMKESGGRRVKQSIHIDLTSIKVYEKKQLEQIERLDILSAAARAKLLAKETQTTNIGTFRLYVEAYLHKHPGVHKDLKILIRQLQGTSTGLPLEIYFFANETESVQYEKIQADIFDHFYAVLPEFDLRAFQLT